jgi:hypothetical protein
VGRRSQRWLDPPRKITQSARITTRTVSIESRTRLFVTIGLILRPRRLRWCESLRI